MLRDQLNEAMKDAMRARDSAALGTIRLILAKLKEVDIAARTETSREGVADERILSMLQGMIKQRNESVVLYEKGNRADLADKEKAEIVVIERFLPKQMDDAAVAGRRRRGGGRGRRQDGQGHGRRDGGAEGQVCRPDGLRQGVGRGEEGAGGIAVSASDGGSAGEFPHFLQFPLTVFRWSRWTVASHGGTRRGLRSLRYPQPFAPTSPAGISGISGSAVVVSRWLARRLLALSDTCTDHARRPRRPGSR